MKTSLAAALLSGLLLAAATAAAAAPAGDGARLPARIVAAIPAEEARTLPEGTLLYASDLLTVHQLDGGELLLSLTLRSREPVVGTWHMQLNDYTFKAAGGPRTTVLLKQPPAGADKLAVRFVPLGMGHPPVRFEPVRLARAVQAPGGTEPASGQTAASPPDRLPAPARAADLKPAAAAYSVEDASSRTEPEKASPRLPALLLGFLFGTEGVSSFLLTGLYRHS
ncbi:hypothetical protein J31TS4_36210 [Paenibacillus sp. J31TS4]|uniref:hypothetical protein n=1 Tax=Paenibacillus sp. J31TS4 TaxID=2807195 RepID=UPI001B06895B|nr:hypothetical protein [Paenibacillus sp. J31TS4]GIP40341.1 hypothetical protein J31TS4_36210 [Paenibacillus sp. J31TS4]